MTAKINYLELPANDLSKIKSFYQQVFQWQFTDYGPEYSAFHTDEMEGGFYLADKSTTVANGGVLIVFYDKDLSLIEKSIVKAGGTIVKEKFSFPGGARFHFADPCGNELAIWSEQ